MKKLMTDMEEMGIVGFDEFILVEKLKKQKLNILETKIHIVVYPKKDKDDARKITLSMEFKVFMLKLHKEIDIKDIAGVFLSRKNAWNAAKDLVRKFGKG